MSASNMDLAMALAEVLEMAKRDWAQSRLPQNGPTYAWRLEALRMVEDHIVNEHGDD